MCALQVFFETYLFGLIVIRFVRQLGPVRTARTSKNTMELGAVRFSNRCKFFLLFLGGPDDEKGKVIYS